MVALVVGRQTPDHEVLGKNPASLGCQVVSLSLFQHGRKIVDLDVKPQNKQLKKVQSFVKQRSNMSWES